MFQSGVADSNVDSYDGSPDLLSVIYSVMYTK